MSDTTKIAEWLWKGFTLVLGVILVPTFGWVWTMQTHMTTLQKDVEFAVTQRVEIASSIKNIDDKIDDIEKNVNGFSSTSNDVGWLKTSLDSLNSKLDRIETRLVNL